MHWFKGAASATEDFGSGRAGLREFDASKLSRVCWFPGFPENPYKLPVLKNVFFHVFCVVFLWRLVESEGMNIWCKGWGFSDTTYGYRRMGSWNASIHQYIQPLFNAQNIGFGSSCKLDQIGWILANCFMHVFFLPTWGHGGSSSLFFPSLKQWPSSSSKKSLLAGLKFEKRQETLNMKNCNMKDTYSNHSTPITDKLPYQLSPRAPRPFWECILSRVFRV